MGVPLVTAVWRLGSGVVRPIPASDRPFLVVTYRDGFLSFPRQKPKV